eukprot:12915762-Prorocentrum_lima.AAC.1
MRRSGRLAHPLWLCKGSRGAPFCDWRRTTRHAFQDPGQRLEIFSEQSSRGARRCRPRRILCDGEHA